MRSADTAVWVLSWNESKQSMTSQNIVDKSCQIISLKDCYTKFSYYKIINVSHLKHVITINRMIWTLIDFIWFLAIFPEKIKNEFLATINMITDSLILPYL